jgi:hypothetical protein
MPFPRFEDFSAVWVEKTKSSHGHGGKGWEFGTCLWSPTTDKSGKRIYKNMLAARPGDLVLHFYEDTPFGNEPDHYLCGLSVVDAAATIREEPPLPGEWAGRNEYYRIGLRDFKSFADRSRFGNLSILMKQKFSRRLSAKRIRLSWSTTDTSA